MIVFYKFFNLFFLQLFSIKKIDFFQILLVILKKKQR